MDIDQLKSLGFEVVHIGDNEPAKEMSFTEVPLKERDKFIPNLVAQNIRAMFNFEAAIFQKMAESNPNYHGGMWHFIEFSNGAKAMVLGLDPKENVQVEVTEQENYYSGTMSLLSLSIAVNMVVCSQMSFMTLGQTQENLANNYHLLRDAMCEHPAFEGDRGEIFGFID